MVARQLHHHPAWTAAGRAAELAAAAGRLELMVTEDLSVAAAFDLSYADLTAGQQRLFRRLGLIPAPTSTATPPPSTAPACGPRAAACEALYDQCLLTEPAAGRYGMHDLIREHARVLAGRLDAERDRDQATGQLLDYYQHTAARADALITRQTCPAPSDCWRRHRGQQPRRPAAQGRHRGEHRRDEVGLECVRGGHHVAGQRAARAA